MSTCWVCNGYFCRFYAGQLFRLRLMVNDELQTTFIAAAAVYSRHCPGIFLQKRYIMPHSG